MKRIIFLGWILICVVLTHPLIIHAAGSSEELDQVPTSLFRVSGHENPDEKDNYRPIIILGTQHISPLDPTVRRELQRIKDTTRKVIFVGERDVFFTTFEEYYCKNTHSILEKYGNLALYPDLKNSQTYDEWTSLTVDTFLAWFKERFSDRLDFMMAMLHDDKGQFWVPRAHPVLVKGFLEIIFLQTASQIKSMDGEAYDLFSGHCAYLATPLQMVKAMAPPEELQPQKFDAAVAWFKDPVFLNASEVCTDFFPPICANPFFQVYANGDSFDTRNQLWDKSLSSLLKEKPDFVPVVAVGALHLGGQNGILSAAYNYQKATHGAAKIDQLFMDGQWREISFDPRWFEEVQSTSSKDRDFLNFWRDKMRITDSADPKAP